MNKTETFKRLAMPSNLLGGMTLVELRDFEWRLQKRLTTMRESGLWPSMVSQLEESQEKVLAEIAERE